MAANPPAAPGIELPRDVVPLVPMRNVVLFPHVMMPITVGRDKSWVKYEATTKVRPAEPAEDARSRAIGHVNESVEIATETVRNRRMR